VRRARQRPCQVRVEVVFWREKDEVIGHCLQFDIVSVGLTLEESMAKMQRLILAHINYVDRHDNWDYLYRPAPIEVWQRFSESLRRVRLPSWTAPNPMTAVEMMHHETRISTNYAFT